jgi:Flp pilus assembly protein TadG
MIKKLRKNQEGSVGLLVGIMLPVLLGFVGLALDAGNLVVVRTQMQNAVDAAVCAGCMKLSLPIPAGQAQATTEANSLLTANNFSPANATVTFTQDTVKNSANAPEINCTLTNNVPTYFMKVLGIATVSLTAYAEAILKSDPGAPFNDTIFSNLSLGLNGSETITGSVYTNNNLNLNGSETITGAAVGVAGVSINGSESLGSTKTGPGNNITSNGSANLGTESYNATTVSMPDYTSQILATPNLTTYNTSQTFNGSTNASGNIYVNGNVTINGSLDYTGTILATGTITVNGSSTITGSNQIFLYSTSNSTNAITLNGSESFATGGASVVVYAPNGTVTTNGSQTLNGVIVGNQVNINGSQNINGNFPITSVSIGTHAQLIG